MPNYVNALDEIRLSEIQGKAQKIAESYGMDSPRLPETIVTMGVDCQNWTCVVKGAWGSEARVALVDGVEYHAYNYPERDRINDLFSSSRGLFRHTRFNSRWTKTRI